MANQTRLGAPQVQTSFGTATKANAKAAAGAVMSFVVTNSNAALRYFQIHNKATAPAGTDVPLLSIPISAGTATAPGVQRLNLADFGEFGLALSTGVGWAISTTAATFTDSATASDHTVNVLFS